MSTYTTTLKDSSDNVILPKTRTSAVYDNNNNRLDNILAEINTQIDGKANASHTHSADDVTSGTLPIARGGTGATTPSEAIANLNGVEKTTEDITYYVNVETGSNSNNGLTEATAFETIQYAIDILPKYITDTATIILATGTYNESVLITGFVGERLIIKGGSNTVNNLEDAGNYIIKSIKITNNSATTVVSNLTCSGVDTSTNASISVAQSPRVYIEYCISDFTTSDTDTIGLLVKQNAQVNAYSLKISNRNTAVYSGTNASIAAITFQGNNNTTVFFANLGGQIKTNDCAITGTTLYSSNTGGTITKDDGSQAITRKSVLTAGSEITFNKNLVWKYGNVVYLDILVTSTTAFSSASDIVIGNLPAGFRPSSSYYFNVGISSAVWAVKTIGTCWINSSGEVRVSDLSDLGYKNARISISFVI